MSAAEFGDRHDIAGRFVVDLGRVPVLRLVELLAHHVVEGAAAEVEDLLEGAAEIAVEGGVDDRVEEGVGVAEPEEERGQGVGDGSGVGEEGSHQRQDEEGQPADGEGRHDDAEGGGGLPLLGQLEPKLPGGHWRLRGQPTPPPS